MPIDVTLAGTMHELEEGRREGEGREGLDGWGTGTGAGGGGPVVVVAV